MKTYRLKYLEEEYDRCGERSVVEHKVDLRTDDLEWSWNQYCRNRRVIGNKYTLIDERD